MLDTVKKLCALNGVSGDEDAVREYILDRITSVADSVTVDIMGNVIALKKGRKTPKKSVMLSAHMDEVGVMVTGFTDDGYVKFACVGGIDRRVIMGKPVYFGKNRLFGVVGNKAIHLVTAEERKKIPALDDMYIDIGASSKSEAEKWLALGETGAFDSTVFEFGDGMLKAKAIDDRVGCAVLIHMLESELPVDCHFVFTVQEEVGTRGAFGAAFRIVPDIALVVEGTTAADLPSVSGVKKICVPGKGVVIPFMDRGTIYNKELYSMLTDVANANNIPWQTKSYIAGGTDASAIQRSRAGVMTAGIATAIRNIHSPSCVASIADMNAMYKLAEKFLVAIGERY
jgi:putative aminopeptidase FrvX